MIRHRQPVSAIALTLAVLAAASCTPGAAPAGNVPEMVQVLSGHYSGVKIMKGCDAGRAVYLAEGDGVAIEIVENAPECAR